MSAKIALTGGGGFLGWHTRAALREDGIDAQLIAMGDRFDGEAAAESVDGASRVIHAAGVNRAADDEVREGNIRFAQQLAGAIRAAAKPPRAVAFANSTQSAGDSIYGAAKRQAAEILANAAADVDAEFIDIVLPNIFGEHGRPFYNSVTATFCHLLAEGGEPRVEKDKQLDLLHAQDAADLLTGRVGMGELRALQRSESVSGLLGRLTSFAQLYGLGEIPDLSTTFDRDLFNTYRSYTFPTHAPLPLTRHADSRGSFFEIIRTHGGSGQSSFSTTEPGISRGDHFHRRKVERFTVLDGKATISLRRLFTDEVLEFEVTGEQPVAVDMPTLWAHKIVNTGSDTLHTSFWTNDLFDPENPDTIVEMV